MRIWLWDSIALHYTPPPRSVMASCQDGWTVTHFKTFEYIGHLQTR